MYYPNQQSARLQFYHDHALGITRLNVYAGMAAGYLIVDDVEDDMIAGTNTTGVFTAAGLSPTQILPDQSDLGAAYKYGIPLIIQDRTFVNDCHYPRDTAYFAATGATPTAKTIDVDPRWDNVLLPVTTTGGDFWFPHEYMPNENTFDPSGFNVMGRWDYGPFLIPPVPALNSVLPSPSIVPEAFMDTMIVNGTPYPFVTLQPKAYRFRILNAANDRMLNLQFYYAASNADNTVCDNTAGTAPTQNTCTEVKMVPAHPNPAFPTWPADGREGGVPDPATAGPTGSRSAAKAGSWRQPAVVPPQPVDFDYNRTSVTFGNVSEHVALHDPGGPRRRHRGLLLGPARFHPHPVQRRARAHAAVRRALRHLHGSGRTERETAARPRSRPASAPTPGPSCRSGSIPRGLRRRLSTYANLATVLPKAFADVPGSSPRHAGGL